MKPTGGSVFNNANTKQTTAIKKTIVSTTLKTAKNNRMYSNRTNSDVVELCCDELVPLVSPN